MELLGILLIASGAVILFAAYCRYKLARPKADDDHIYS